VGVFADPDESAMEWFGPTAPDGVLRLGICSKLGAPPESLTPQADLSHWIVFDKGYWPEFLSQLDEAGLREAWGVDESDRTREWSTTRLLEATGRLHELEGRLWLDSGHIWEYGPDMRAWEQMERGNDIIRTIPLGLQAVTIPLEEGGSLTRLRRGNAATAWSPRAVLEPIVHREIEDASERMATGESDAVAEGLRALDSSLRDLLGRLSSAHSAAFEAEDPFSAISWRSRLLPDALSEAITRSLAARVTSRGGTASRETLLPALGPGSQRTLAIRALELYRDPELWPTRNGWGIPTLTILLIEEPESGLHPAAQRALAKTLRSLATYGLQVVLVTHSATFVNSAETTGIRLARKEVQPDGGVRRFVVTPTTLDEIRGELGLHPSDVLLARRFVIVEGPSDAIVLDIWGRRLGLDLAADGVRLIPAGGSGKAGEIARFLSIAYEGSDFIVVLDNGRDSAKHRLEIETRFGDRVAAILLGRPAIEAYFHPDAVTAWLRTRDVLDADLDERVRTALDAPGGAVRGLEKLAEEYIGGPYSKTDHGRAIANLSTEEMIDAEIKGLLVRLAA
jgi:hypothetical protein